MLNAAKLRQQGRIGTILTIGIAGDILAELLAELSFVSMFNRDSRAKQRTVGALHPQQCLQCDTSLPVQVCKFSQHAKQRACHLVTADQNQVGSNVYCAQSVLLQQRYHLEARLGLQITIIKRASRKWENLSTSVPRRLSIDSWAAPWSVRLSARPGWLKGSKRPAEDHRMVSIVHWHAMSSMTDMQSFASNGGEHTRHRAVQLICIISC